jgi:hypothetical protein
MLGNVNKKGMKNHPLVAAICETKKLSILRLLNQL